MSHEHPHGSDDPHHPPAPEPCRPVPPREMRDENTVRRIPRLPTGARAAEFLRIVGSPGQGTVMADFPRMLLLPRDARASGVSGGL
jgi:hypothetical protein